MMVAIKARNEEEIKRICKEHKIDMWPSTISWWLSTWSNPDFYLCISVENGKQRGGGHACRKTELGSTIILTTRRRLI